MTSALFSINSPDSAPATSERRSGDSGLVASIQLAPDGQILQIDPSLRQLLDNQSPQSTHNVREFLAQWNPALTNNGTLATLIEAARQVGSSQSAFTQQPYPTYFDSAARLRIQTHPLVVNTDRSGRGVLITIEAERATARENLDDQQRIEIALESGRHTMWEWNIVTDELREYGTIADLTADPDDQIATSIGVMQSRAHPDDVPLIKERMAAYLRGETPAYEIEHRYRSQDGEYRWMRAVGKKAQVDENGRAMLLAGLYTDITDLKTQQERLNIALRNSRQDLWEWDPVGDRLMLSDTWPLMFGYDPSEIASVREKFGLLIHPDDLARVSESVTAALKDPSASYDIEYRIRHKDGHYVWIADRGLVLERAADGRATRVIGSHLDISEYRNTADALKRSEAFLQLILDTIPDSVFWKGPDRRYQGCNQHYAEFIGLDHPRDIVGRRSDDLFVRGPAEEYETDDRAVLETGEPIHGVERQFFDAKGNEHWIEVTKIPLRAASPHNEIIGILGHIHDITEKHRRRQLLEALAKMVSNDRGTRSLHALVNGALDVAKVDFGFVGKYSAEKNVISLVAWAGPGSELDNFTYQLAGTPCENAIDTDLCVYPQNVQTLFPNDDMLKRLAIQGYAGKQLIDEFGRTIGIFVLMSQSPIADADQVSSLIDILSSTFGHELLREEREQLLVQSEKSYRQIYNSVPVMIATTDANHQILDVNSTWEAISGQRRQNILDKPIVDCFLASDRDRMIETILADPDSTQAHSENPLHLIDTDEQLIAVTHRAVSMDSPNGRRITINVFEDARERLKAEEETRLAATAFETHEALVIRDAAQRILRVNEAFVRMTGYQASEVIGKCLEFITDESVDGKSDLWTAVAEQGTADGEGMCVRKDNSAFNSWRTITAVKTTEGTTTHFVENFADLSDYKDALAENKRLAYFDPLTELPNRRQLSEKLDASLSAAYRHEQYGAVMFIDLDHFKNINDSVGHSVGDKVLQQVGARLRKLMRKEDTIGRLGGDEFVVLIPDIADNRDDASTQASQIAEKLQRDLRRIYYVNDHEFHLTPSIGVTIFPDRQESVDDVLKEADTAMYRAKEDGRNQTIFYNHDMQVRAQERLAIEKDLRTAVQRGELHLVFQPQLDNWGEVRAAEALLRWQHPVRGPVSPVEFIPVAEETGLIVEIGRWVLDEAFSTLTDWEQRYGGLVDHLAVNVSSRQFSAHDFVDDVIRRLNAHGTNPDRVVLEVTESTVIDTIQATVSKMEQLKRVGIRFSVDDFGTGYSSLAYLSRLPLDQLKIDRTFVSDILADPTNAVIAETIIVMGRHLGLETVAEGVENEAQLEFLTERECNAFQGFYFSKPITRPDFESFVLENRKRRG